MGWLDWLRRWLAPMPDRPDERTRGRPPSGNGASSFHLWWSVPSGRITGVAATLEVRTPPQSDALYFFAVQASFHRAGSAAGGAHLGLQWNARFPDGRAANWGGYDRDGSILAGTPSPLPSTPNDPNTRDYAWQPGRRYRLEIGPAQRSGDRWEWPGTVTDLDTGEAVTIRRLISGGDELTNPVVWSEVFAECDAPSVAVRWTDLVVTTADAATPIPTCSTAYQDYDNGGCTNTNSTVQGSAFVQTTNTVRTTPAGALLDL